MRKKVTITTEEQNAIREQSHQASIQKAEMLLWERLLSITPKQHTAKQQIDWDKALQEVYDHRCIAKPDMYLGTNGTNPVLEKLSVLHKEITGHVISKRKRISINRSLSDLHQSERPYHRATQAIEQIQSNNYQQGSWEISKYFSKTSHGELYEFREKFARAFDCYIADKLQEAGIENQYLTAHADEFEFQIESGRTIYAFPMGEERKQINQKFDELILRMKELGLFHQRKEQEQSLSTNKENASKETAKTSITNIQSMVAEQRKEREFGRKVKTNPYYGR